jgi:hypothetical protein
MTNLLKQLNEQGVLVFQTNIPEHLTQYTLNYIIPQSDGRDVDQVELDYRTVDDNFPYSELLKELIYKALGSPEDMKELIFRTPDVIVQELKPNTKLDWHHDAYTFEDGTKLQFEVLLYVANTERPDRYFAWKDKRMVQGRTASPEKTVRIQHGSCLVIDCSTDYYVHSASGSTRLNEKIVTLLLGCR